jgi:hypothetical protein
MFKNKLKCTYRATIQKRLNVALATESPIYECIMLAQYFREPGKLIIKIHFYFWHVIVYRPSRLALFMFMPWLLYTHIVGVHSVCAVSLLPRSLENQSENEWGGRIQMDEDSHFDGGVRFHSFALIRCRNATQNTLGPALIQGAARESIEFLSIFVAMVLYRN